MSELKLGCYPIKKEYDKESLRSFLEPSIKNEDKTANAIRCQTYYTNKKRKAENSEKELANLLAEVSVLKSEVSWIILDIGGAYFETFFKCF